MRVLHFFKTALPDSIGGIEQVIHQLAMGASHHGVTSDVLALTDGESRTIEQHGYRVHLLKASFELASTSFSWGAFRQFSRMASQADIIHYQYPWPFMDLVHFATRCKKPSVVSYQSDIVRQKKLLQIYRPLQQRFLHAVDRVVVTSPNYLASSTELQPFRSKTSVIPIGLDKASYAPVEPERIQKWRQLLGERFFLFIGVLRYYKGLHTLLDAAKAAGYPVVIMGAGPVEADLKRQAKTCGINNVHFLGALPEADKSALLQLCFALVFPSHLRSEAFGISLLEGAMYGKPLISCEIGTGTTYINVDRETGCVIPPEDPAALRAAMDWMWNNSAAAAGMGERAAQRYQEHFTAERMVSDYVQLYRQLLASKAATCQSV